MTNAYINFANIKRFRTLLSTCTDEVQRLTFEALLAAEQKKLANISNIYLTEEDVPPKVPNRAPSEGVE